MRSVLGYATILVLLVAIGCRKEAESLSSGTVPGSGDPVSQSEESATQSNDEGIATPGKDPTKSGNPATAAPLPPGETKDGKTAPDGRVFCDVCGGHMPREDAVEVDGKTMCLADAEEAKTKKK